LTKNTPLSVLTAIFPGKPGFGARVMEVVVTTGAIRRAKLQSNCHHQQTNSNAQLFTGWLPFLSRTGNQQCQKHTIV